VMVVSLVLVMLFSTRLYKLFGLAAVGIYWVLLIGMSSFVFFYGLWKYTILEKVNDEPPKTP
jgi:hypothetical protein